MSNAAGNVTDKAISTANDAKGMVTDPIRPTDTDLVKLVKFLFALCLIYTIIVVAVMPAIQGIFGWAPKPSIWWGPWYAGVSISAFNACSAGETLNYRPSGVNLDCNSKDHWSMETFTDIDPRTGLPAYSAGKVPLEEIDRRDIGHSGFVPGGVAYKPTDSDDLPYGLGKCSAQSLADNPEFGGEDYLDAYFAKSKGMDPGQTGAMVSPFYDENITDIPKGYMDDECMLHGTCKR